MLTIGMVGTVVLHVGVGSWWLSQLSATTARNAQQIVTLRDTLEKQAHRLESLVRLDADMKHVRAGLGRLQASLDKLSDRTRFTAAPRDRTQR